MRKSDRYHRPAGALLLSAVVFVLALAVVAIFHERIWSTALSLVLIGIAAIAWVAGWVWLLGAVRLDPQLSDQERIRHRRLVLLGGPIVGFPLILRRLKGEGAAKTEHRHGR